MIRRPCPPRREAFTLLEMLIAMALMVLAMLIAFTTFGSVSKAWQRGVALSEGIRHGDFIMEQLVMALRSAYFPEGAANASSYGFWLEDGGDGPRSSDRMSWVKLGHALIESKASYAGGPHRVAFDVETEGGRDGESGAAVRGWRVYGQPDDFDPDEVAPVFLSSKVTGFNCRIATNMVDDRIEWQDDWEDTNRIPFAVELTLYMEPTDEGQPPIEIKRAVALPVSPLSWQF
jgi:prepilin-type N-terminal cleavage/methylation domain-containing protein